MENVINRPKPYDHNSYFKHDLVRVLTFNLLSSVLADPKIFHTVPNEYLSSVSRWNRIIKLLSSWIKKGYVLCLQEISDEWDCKLAIFLNDNGYFYKSCVYKGDALGVGIAFPLNYYDPIKIDIFRPSVYIKEINENVQNDLDIKEEKKYRELREQIEEASFSANKMISMVLLNRSSQKKFLISTYHMPCKFTKNYFMLCHIHGIQKRLKFLNSIEDMPVILTGDFNIQPKTIEYDYLTNIYDLNNNEKSNTDKLKIFIDALQRIDNCFNERHNVSSVFQSIGQEEPEFTNLAVMPEYTFKGTLDYILISDSKDRTIKVKSCMVGLTMDNPEQVGYPNYLCPSDHLPLSSNLFILDRN